MDLGKLKRGELIAAAGGLLLLITLFGPDWYSRSSPVVFGLGDTGVGAFDDVGFFGAIATFLILAAALTALTLAILTVTSRTVALPVAASAATTALGIVAVAMVLLRMIFQPGPNAFVDLEFGIVLALIGALLVAFGGWESMKEEGTSFEDARAQLESRYARRPAPEPRPAPGPEPGPGEDTESRPPPPP